MSTTPDHATVRRGRRQLLALAALFFITRVAGLTEVTEASGSTAAIRAYRVYGSLFFGSANRLEPLLALAEPGDAARVVVLGGDDFTPNELAALEQGTLRPLDMATVLASVRKTNRCVVVEEGWRYAGFGAEIADRVQRECFDSLDAPVIRVTAGFTHSMTPFRSAARGSPSAISIRPASTPLRS